jgi:hypothetical protein
MYFRAVFFALAIRHKVGLCEKVALLKLTSILEYFANVLGERRAWRVEIEVMVEDNGTIFLVYPLSDSAQEWFDLNTSRNTQRLGDIRFVEPRHLYDLVEAMLDSDLWVVWSSGSLIPKERSAEGPREGLSGDGVPSRKSPLAPRCAIRHQSPLGSTRGLQTWRAQRGSTRKG